MDERKVVANTRETRGGGIIGEATSALAKGVLLVLYLFYHESLQKTENANCEE